MESTSNWRLARSVRRSSSCGGCGWRSARRPPRKRRRRKRCRRGILDRNQGRRSGELIRIPTGGVIMKSKFVRIAGLSAVMAGAAALPQVVLAQAWEPTKTVEFIVPAGTGGGADQMARVVQGIIAKNNLMKQSMVVVNKAGGAGAEGFLDVKGAKGDPHKIIITLSNLFTTPLAPRGPF